MTTVDAERLRAALAGPEAAARVAGRAAQGGRPAAVLIALAEHAEGTRIVLVEKDARLAALMRVSGLPTTLLVDADGKVVHTIPGKLQSYDELVQLTRDKLGISL